MKIENQENLFTPDTMQEFLSSDYYKQALEQFKASKEAREWEIVAYSFKPLSGKISREPIIGPNSKYWQQAQQDSEDYAIHSVRRLSDGEVFSVGDRIKPNAAHHPIIITQFTATEKTLRVHNKYGYFLSGEQYWEQMRKAPAPIFVTVDGVEILDGQEYWGAETTGLPFRFRAAGKHVSPSLSMVFFSTEQAAQEYITNHKPVLSLNDVREWVEAAIRSNLSMDFILEKAEHTVKQKLNPDNLKK